MSKVRHNNADYFINQSTLTAEDLKNGLLDGSLVMLNSGEVLYREDYVAPKKLPLHEAAKKGNVAEFVKILHEDDNIDLLELDSIGDNLLHCVASGGNNWIASIILTHCTKEQVASLINQRGFSGMTPLQWAVLSNNKELVNSLLSHGAKIDSADDEGYTALHYAASEGCSVDILQFLIAHIEESGLQDIMMHTTECGSETVFDTALGAQNVEICKFLQPYAEMMGVEGFVVPTEDV